MANVLNHLNGDQVVRLAELKATLEVDPKREYDREAKQSLIRQWCKTMNGLPYALKAVDNHYGFSATTTLRYMRELTKLGKVSVERGGGHTNIYTWHDTPLPASERTARKYNRRKGVTTRVDLEIVTAKTTERLETIAIEAVAERDNKREQFILATEQAVMAYLFTEHEAIAAEDFPALRRYLKSIKRDK